MKERKLLLVVFCLFTLLAMAQGKGKDYVEVLYFHGKQRCKTCIAIEKYAKEVVAEDFAKEQKNGRVVFKVVDISTSDGERIAKSYRVTWSSLYVNGWKKGKETRKDMTAFAFKNARSDTDKFKKGVSATIRKLLK